MLSKIERIKSSLQIDENIDLHVTGWIAQRIGWLLMFAFLICAAAGLFGSGVLSQKSNTQDGNSIKYERFTRYESDTEVEIRAKSTHTGQIELKLPDQFTRSFKVESIMPEPLDQKTINGSSIYTFSAGGEGEITLFLSARKVGNVNTTLGINGTDHPFQTYIYP